MMKKLKAFFFTFVFFLASNNVYAVCDATELNNLNRLAVNVSVDYEAITEEYEPDENITYPDGLTQEEWDNYVFARNVFQIYISNLTKEIYVTVSDNVTNETQTYTYADSNNGVVTIRQLDLTNITTYTVTVYSSSETNCPDTLLYTQYLTTPMYNSYSDYTICEGAEDFYLCYEYLSVPTVSFDRFVELVEDYKAGRVDNEGEEIVPPEEEEEESGFGDFVREHRVVIISVCLVIVIGGVLVTVIVIKKRRSQVV